MEEGVVVSCWNNNTSSSQRSIDGEEIINNCTTGFLLASKERNLRVFFVERAEPKIMPTNYCLMAGISSSWRDVEYVRN